MLAPIRRLYVNPTVAAVFRRPLSKLPARQSTGGHPMSSQPTPNAAGEGTDDSNVQLAWAKIRARLRNTGIEVLAYIAIFGWYKYLAEKRKTDAANENRQMCRCQCCGK